MSAGNDREFIDELQGKEGGKAMKCPRMSGVIQDKDGNIGFVKEECLKEECAWWVEEPKRCTMPLLYFRLLAIANVLFEIEQKMPHAGQFLQKP